MSDEGYSRYKPIRNDIRQYNSESLLLITIKNLNELLDLSPYEWGEKGLSPWELLLLIKWILYESKNSKDTNPKDQDFRRIVNKIKDFNDDFGVPEGTKYRLEKFLRKIAFQQFWLQAGQTLDKTRLGRTIELFLKMPCEYDLDSLLMKEIGLNRQDFFDFSYIAWIKLNSSEKADLSGKLLTFNFYSSIRDINQEKLVRFFSAISLDWEGAQKWSEEATANRSFELQKFEQTPFKQFPFLRTKKGLLCYCPIMFSDLLENFFYDFAKLKSNGAFNAKFGLVFEEYVGRGVKNISESFLNEAEIRKRYNNKKSVDYYIEGEEGNLLVECKAVELSPLARVNPSDEILEKHLKDSIIKSISQSIEVISGSKNSSNKPRTNVNYIFIVTYKELYLGNGEAAWGEFIRDAVLKLYPHLDLSIVDPAKLFFVSIHDFDRVAAIYEGRPDELIRKLKAITDLKLDPKDCKYVFGMYFCETTEATSKTLKKNFEEYSNHWIARLQK